MFFENHYWSSMRVGDQQWLSPHVQEQLSEKNQTDSSNRIHLHYLNGRQVAESLIEVEMTVVREAVSEGTPNHLPI